MYESANEQLQPAAPDFGSAVALNSDVSVNRQTTASASITKETRRSRSCRSGSGRQHQRDQPWPTTTKYWSHCTINACTSVALCVLPKTLTLRLHYWVAAAAPATSSSLTYFSYCRTCTDGTLVWQWWCMASDAVKCWKIWRLWVQVISYNGKSRHPLFSLLL